MTQTGRYLKPHSILKLSACSRCIVRDTFRSLFSFGRKAQRPMQSEQKPYLGRRVLAERFCPRLPKLSMRGELPAGDPRDLAGDCLRWGDRRMAGGGLMTISTEDVCSGDDRLGGGPVGGGLWAAKGGTSCATSCSISFCQPGTSFRFPIKGPMQKISTLQLLPCLCCKIGRSNVPRMLHEPRTAVWAFLQSCCAPLPEHIDNDRLEVKRHALLT